MNEMKNVSSKLEHLQFLAKEAESSTIEQHEAQLKNNPFYHAWLFDFVESVGVSGAGMSGEMEEDLDNFYRLLKEIDEKTKTDNHE